MSDENVFAKSVMAQMTDTPTSAPTEAATGDKATEPTKTTETAAQPTEAKEVTPQRPESAEKADSTPTDTEEESPAGLSTEQSANWKALRQAKKEADRELKEYKAKLTDLASKLDHTSSELESSRKIFDLEAHNKLKAELEDAHNQLTEVDILRSPEVKAAQDRVKTEIQKAETAIRRQLPEQEGLSRILGMAPEQRDKAVTNLLEDADPRVAARVWNLVDKIDSAQMEAEASMTLAQDKVQAWRQTKDAQLKSQQEAQQKQATDLFLQGLQAAQDTEGGFPEYFAEQEGEQFEDSNKLVRESTNFARRVLTEPMSEEELAQVAFLAGIGKAAPLRQQAMTHALAASERERSELKARIEELEKASPTGSGSFNEGGGSSDAGAVGAFAKAVLNHEG